jgi:hypothetical protein
VARAPGAGLPAIGDLLRIEPMAALLQIRGRRAPKPVRNLLLRGAKEDIQREILDALYAAGCEKTLSQTAVLSRPLGWLGRVCILVLVRERSASTAELCWSTYFYWPIHSLLMLPFLIVVLCGVVYQWSPWIAAIPLLSGMPYAVVRRLLKKRSAAVEDDLYARVESALAHRTLASSTKAEARLGQLSIPSESHAASGHVSLAVEPDGALSPIENRSDANDGRFGSQPKRAR